MCMQHRQIVISCLAAQLVLLPSTMHADEAPSVLCIVLQVFACTVGQKPSKAPFYVNDTVRLFGRFRALYLMPVCQA